jgi:LacI family transcriptional regulator
VSLQQVAQLAGVSTSTVSRVVNAHPAVAADTAASVRQAMLALSFTPAKRRRLNGRDGRAGGTNHRATAIAFLVFGTAGSKAAPAFERLLHGVSTAANDNDLDLMFSSVSDPAHLPARSLGREIGGILLHGERPAPAVAERLRPLPTVWLMANRQRPQWGDQVMPDNTVIGEIAAKYLLGRGHRRVAYLGAGGGGAWSLGLRAFAFAQVARDAGADVHAFSAAERTPDYRRSDGLAAVAESLVGQLARVTAPAPTGLFVAEDRLVSAIDRALGARGLRVGPGGDVEIISCNNEQPHLIGLHPRPATIDIRPDAIGRRGVEQLLWRMRNPGVPERVRHLVEPALIEPDQDG